MRQEGAGDHHVCNAHHFQGAVSSSPQDQSPSGPHGPILLVSKELTGTPVTGLIPRDVSKEASLLPLRPDPCVHSSAPTPPFIPWDSPFQLTLFCYHHKTESPGPLQKGWGRGLLFILCIKLRTEHGKAFHITCLLLGTPCVCHPGRPSSRKPSISITVADLSGAP